MNTIDIDTLNVRIRGLVDVLRDEEQDQVGIADVASVAEVLITIMQRYFGTIDVSLYQEFQELSAHIAQTRTEIAKLQAGKIQGEKLPSAGQELDAIVAATEEATNTIMEAAEQMMEGDASDSDAYKATVDAACMRIFEACSSSLANHLFECGLPSTLKTNGFCSQDPTPLLGPANAWPLFLF